MRSSYYEQKDNLALTKPFYDLATNNESSVVTTELCHDGIKLRITMYSERLALKAISLFGELNRKVKPFEAPFYRGPTPDKNTGVYIEVIPVKFVFSSFKNGMESVSVFDELHIK